MPLCEYRASVFDLFSPPVVCFICPQFLGESFSSPSSSQSQDRHLMLICAIRNPLLLFPLLLLLFLPSRHISRVGGRRKRRRRRIPWKKGRRINGEKLSLSLLPFLTWWRDFFRGGSSYVEYGDGRETASRVAARGKCGEFVPISRRRGAKKKSVAHLTNSRVYRTHGQAAAAFYGAHEQQFTRMHRN